MLSIRSLCATLFLAALAAATQCEVGRSGIYSPASNATLTLGQPFNLTFCSGAYFKTHTIDIDVVVYPCTTSPCGSFTGGEEAVHALAPEDSYGYHTNVTLYAIDGSQRTGQWAIGVLDHTSGYYTAGDVYEYFVPVRFVPGSDSKKRGY
ncbi:uncharacterized protein BDZ99DRAFT_461743 [Mytilinidion resinicola]|uniref:Uncharacterized protein n=1 Tax=Mytilinidion resinicola TaxID=574789 RepID=A0A6A6YS24_9PEZI|nr:uncharacterized protein BDZ99DRAFT_461743 [Mytilinidion resinicola]KAF2811746.1 hypothetical protein BDZ99DRAFT_461743 [Mytilinidion resinicola]